jgi:phytoene/squalene synthetase
LKFATSARESDPQSVSRSFYLTIRFLPRPLREPVGLAYLLARATDTIADTVHHSGRHRA